MKYTTAKEKWRGHIRGQMPNHSALPTPQVFLALSLTGHKYKSRESNSRIPKFQLYFIKSFSFLFYKNVNIDKKGVKISKKSTFLK